MAEDCPMANSGVFPLISVVTIGPLKLRRYWRLEYKYIYKDNYNPGHHNHVIPKDKITISDMTSSSDGTGTGTQDWGEIYSYEDPGGTVREYTVTVTYSVIYDFANVHAAADLAGYTKANGYQFLGFKLSEQSSMTPAFLPDQPETHISGIDINDSLIDLDDLQTHGDLLLIINKLGELAFQGGNTKFLIYSDKINTDPGAWQNTPGESFYNIYMKAYFCFEQDIGTLREGFNDEDATNIEGNPEKPGGPDQDANRQTSNNPTGGYTNTGSRGGLGTIGASRYSYPQVFSDMGSFDHIYIPTDIWADVQIRNGVVVGDGIVGIDNISVDYIKLSLTEVDEIGFTEFVKYDENGSFTEGDKVFGLVKGTTRFMGYITSKNRTISSSEQYIKYTAAGIRQWLNNLPFAQIYNVNDYTVKQLFEEVVKSIPSFLVADYDVSILPDKIVPEFYVSAANIGPTLEQILDKAGHYGYYIDTTKKLTVYDLSDLASYYNLIMSKEEWRLEDHPECVILQKNLTVDLSNCKTRAIVIGDNTVTVKRVRARVTIVPNSIFYCSISLGHQIASNIPGKDVAVIIEPITPNASGGFLTVSPLFTRLSDGYIFGVASQHKTSYFDVYVTYAEVGSPLIYDTGWKGTAYSLYNVQNVLQKYDTSYRIVVGSEGYDCDDTSSMKELAESLIAPYQDAPLGGTVQLNGIVTGLVIGMSVRLTNTTQTAWTTTDLVIRSIRFNIAELTTTVELTSNYFLGSGIIDPRVKDKQKKTAAEEQWNGLMQRLSKLETKGKYMLAPGPGGVVGFPGAG